jgi:hypothetical protein
MSYQPPFAPEVTAALRRWHERAYREMSEAGERQLSYLGLDLVVPAGVFAPTPMSDLLGRPSSTRHGRVSESWIWAPVPG